MKRQYTTALYFIAILLGIFSGLSEMPSLHAVAGLISDIFIRIFQCISLPIIALSIIVTLSSYTAEIGLRKIWKRTLLFTFSTTFVAAAISALLYLLIQPRS